MHGENERQWKKKTKREHSSVSTEELFSLITEASSWIHSNYVPPNFPPLCGIEQSDSLTLLGVTLQNDCKFSSPVKGKLREANNCLYILRSLRKDGYTRVEIDHLFKAIVLPKITDALPVYGASQVDLNTIQCFLKRCNKQRYTSELINIYDLLEKCDRRLFTKIKNNVNHPLYALLRKVKESSKRLRSQASSITTD